VSHDHKFGLAILNQLSDVVETELDVDGLGSLLLVILLAFSFFVKSGFLVFFGLRTVLCQQFEELTCLILINCVLELMDSRGNLESLKKNSLLSLNSDILRPLHESSEVSLRLDVTSNSKVTSIL